MMMIEDERQEHVARLKKMESEMEQVFELKVKEKKQKMKDSEIDVSTCNCYSCCSLYGFINYYSKLYLPLKSV